MAQRYSGHVLAVKDVAKVLEVCDFTISRMIGNGELEVRRQGWRYRIPVESLQKWIFRTLGMHGAARICKQAERNEEISLKKSPHFSGLAHSYIQTDTQQTHLFHESQSQNELEPAEAIVRLKPLMRKLAVRFGGKDSWMRDDLFQEMALAILECEGRNTVMYYADLVEWRAIDCVRREYERGKVYEYRLRLEECVMTVPKADCSMVVALFKLARLPLCMLQMFGVWLEDEEAGGEEEMRVA